MTKTSDDKSQGMPEGFYCNAAICNGCGHVYMERPSSCDCGNDESINGFEPAAVFTTADLSTPAAPQADEWVKCSQRLPRIGQRVILRSKGVVQNYMPTLDQGDIDGFGGGDGYFWCFDDAIGDEDYPLVDFETDEWMPCPQPPEQGDGV